MSERQTVKVLIVRKGLFSAPYADGEYESELAAVRAWLESCAHDIPDEYRGSTFIDVESFGAYNGEQHREVVLYYTRPETDEEMAAREEREREEHLAELNYPDAR